MGNIELRTHCQNLQFQENEIALFSSHTQKNLTLDDQQLLVEPLFFVKNNTLQRLRL